MSRGLNNVQIFGGLVRDPEVKHGQSGTAYMMFTLAVGYAVKKPDGSGYEERAEYVPCKVWGNTAENIGRYCRKGSRLLVSGRIRTESYEKNGEKVFSTFVAADSVIFGDSPKGGTGESEQPANTPPVSEHERSKSNGYQPDKHGGWNAKAGPQGMEEEDDIPF